MALSERAPAAFVYLLNPSVAIKTTVVPVFQKQGSEYSLARSRKELITGVNNANSRREDGCRSAVTNGTVNAPSMVGMAPVFGDSVPARRQIYRVAHDGWSRAYRM